MGPKKMNPEVIEAFSKMWTAKTIEVGAATTRSLLGSGAQVRGLLGPGAQEESPGYGSARFERAAAGDAVVNELAK